MESEHYQKLRRLAEQIVDTTEVHTTEDSIPIVEKLLTELQVYRAELDIQHEELKQAYRELEKERDNYVRLYHSAPVGYVTLDADGAIVEANTTSTYLLDRPMAAVVGLRIANLIAPEQQDKFHVFRRSLFRTGQNQADIFLLNTDPERAIYVQFVGTYQPATETKPALAHCALYDMTGQKHLLLLEALQDTALLLTSTLEIDYVLDRVFELMQNIVPYDTACLLLYDQAATLRIARIHGQVDRQEYMGQTLTPDKFLRSLPRNAVHIIDEEQTTCVFNPLDIDGLTETVLVPLAVWDNTLGYLCLFNRERSTLQRTQQPYLSSFARQVALALNNARLYAQSQSAATRRERQRIARELHDAVKQNLFGAYSLAQNLIRHDLPEPLNERVALLHEALRDATHEMKSVLHDLRPEHIVNVAMADLLHDLGRNVQREGVTLDLQVAIVDPLAPAIKLAIYRITQEALHNSSKYAGAGHVTVRLISRAGTIRLTISDDGTGFDPDEVTGGLGLHHMRERAAETGGSFALRSAPESGTRIDVSWAAIDSTES
jgi:signal transduction histidine kinase